MNQSRRPYRGGLFDDTSGGPGQNGRPPAQPKSLFGSYVPPTPKQQNNSGTDAPRPAAATGQPGASAPAQAPAAHQPPPTPQAGNGRGQGGAPLRPPAPTPKAPSPQGRAAPPLQPGGTAPQAQKKDTQPSSQPDPTSPAHQQVYRPSDSGQRLSQFEPGPRPAASDASSPPPETPYEAYQRILREQKEREDLEASLAKAAREGATRVGTPPLRSEDHDAPRPTEDATTLLSAEQKKPPARPAKAAPAKAQGAAGGGGKPPAKKGKRKTTGRYVLRNLGLALFSLFCVGLIVASLLGVQIARYLVASTENDDLVLDLNTLASSENGALLAWDAESGQWVEYYKIIGESNFIWTDYADMSPYLIEALISTEDKQFYDHNGVSWTRTAYAGLNQVFSLSDRQFGGSTINQQLVKNITGDAAVIDKESGSMAPGYLRKMREIFRAIGINNNYSKATILEAYLNTMPLTGTIKGVGAGAKEYFNKTPAQLDLHEAAMIVGVTNWPAQYNPYTKPEKCLERRNYVLKCMYDDGKLTKEDYEATCEKPLGLYTGTANKADEVITSWFADAALNQVRDDLVKNGFVNELEDASSLLLNGGFQIELTVDLAIQAKLEELYLHAYEEGSPFPDVSVTNEAGKTVRPQSAMTIMDYEGNVLASVGGTGEKTVSRALNRASMSPRQVGSTMKMIAAYALGLEYNLITFSDYYRDEYVWYRNGDSGNAYDWPNNYGGSVSGNMVRIDNAVTVSTNTIAARVAVMVGKEQLFDHAYYSMGLKHLISEEEEPNPNKNDFNYSSLAIGGNQYGATTEEMAAAYAVYGNGGQYHSARYYTRVLDSQGNVIMRSDDSIIQAVSEETAYIMNRLMYNVMYRTGGTALGMAVDGFETVGKTGTTNEDNDRWFIGLTPYYVGAIWWGYDTEDTLYGYSTNPATNGTTAPWKYVMNQIHEGLEEKSFPDQPEGVVTAAFCASTGRLATESCGNRGTGYYKSDNLPAYCVGHSEGEEG